MWNDPDKFPFQVSVPNKVHPIFLQCSHHRILQPRAEDIFSDPGEASSFLGPWLVPSCWYIIYIILIFVLSLITIVIMCLVYYYRYCYHYLSFRGLSLLKMFVYPHQVECSECLPTVEAFWPLKLFNCEARILCKSAPVDLFYSLGIFTTVDPICILRIRHHGVPWKGLKSTVSKGWRFRTHHFSMNSYNGSMNCKAASTHPTVDRRTGIARIWWIYRVDRNIRNFQAKVAIS